MSFKAQLVMLFAHYYQFANSNLKIKPVICNHIKNDLQKLNVLDLL